MGRRASDLAKVDLIKGGAVGEVLAMGTVGNGCGYESLTFLDDGDVVDIEAEPIGRLRNRLVRRTPGRPA